MPAVVDGVNPGRVTVEMTAETWAFGEVRGTPRGE